ELHFHGETVPMLDRVLGNHSGVIGRSTSDNYDLVYVAEVLVRHPDLVERDVTGFGKTAAQRVGDGLGLFGYLLEHEVFVAVFFGRRRVPVDLEVVAVGALAVEIGD